MRTRFSHDRVYCTFLALFIPLTAFTAFSLLYWHIAIGEPIGHLPAWAVPWTAACNLAYSIAMTVTLLLRFVRPDAGRRLTRILNWALVPALLCGTLLGLYGLWKVDRART